METRDLYPQDPPGDVRLPGVLPISTHCQTWLLRLSPGLPLASALFGDPYHTHTELQPGGIATRLVQLLPHTLCPLSRPLLILSPPPTQQLLLQPPPQLHPALAISNPLL